MCLLNRVPKLVLFLVCGLSDEKFLFGETGQKREVPPRYRGVRAFLSLSAPGGQNGCILKSIGSRFSREIASWRVPYDLRLGNDSIPREIETQTNEKKRISPPRGLPARKHTKEGLEPKRYGTYSIYLSYKKTRLATKSATKTRPNLTTKPAIKARAAQSHTERIRTYGKCTVCRRFPAPDLSPSPWPR